MKNGNCNSNGFEQKYNLIGLEELMVLLGYNDERSVRKWCSDNQIPILELGKRRYIHKDIILKMINAGLSVNGNRAPVENSKPGAASRYSVYTPENEVISKYLNKYENDVNSSTTKEK